MKLIQLCLFLVVIIAATFSAILRGENVDKPDSNEIPDFTAPRGQLDEKVNNLVQKYYDLNDVLISQLGNKNVPDDNKAYIIYLITTYRDSRAVSALLDNVDFVAPWVDPKDRIGRWGPHPALEALVYFGKHASLECLHRLGNGADRATKIENNYTGGNFTVRELYLEVIKQVEGNEVAKFMLQRAIEKEQDKDKKANLTAALALLNQWIEKESAREPEPTPTSAGNTAPPATPTATDTGRTSGTPNSAGTGTSSEGGAEGAVAEASPFPWAIVIVVAIAALGVGSITTFLFTRAKKTAK